MKKSVLAIVIAVALVAVFGAGVYVGSNDKSTDVEIAYKPGFGG